MNTLPNDSPELTAYALGELSAGQARDVHALLASLPAALSELEQVEAITDALRQGAPIPQQRLTPEQRHAVLHPAQLPRLVVPMMPRQAPRRRPAQFWPAVRSLTQAAAVVALAGVAFLVGRNISLSESKIASATPAAPVVPDVATKTVTAQAPAPAAIVQDTPKVAAVTEIAGPPAPEAAPVVRPEVVVIPATDPTPKAVVAAAPVAPAVPAPKVAPAPKPVQPAQVVAVSFTTPPASDIFVNASRRASDQVALHPSMIRPEPVRQDRAQQFASPAPAKPAADGKANKGRPANLYIHSWKADVTTCPWNEANRLLRVAIQLPADQAAVSGDSSYPVQVAFDANAVREYRMLCERHQPASELRTAGTHTIWYEFLPNGAAEPNRENGKHIATVTLPEARFTTQAVAPFDGSRLSVLDRGQTWQSARDEFVFESAVVGFGMLLRGAPQTGRLNHQLVLDLAGKSKAAEANSERARFIRLVQEAKQAAGL